MTRVERAHIASGPRAAGRKESTMTDEIKKEQEGVAMWVVRVKDDLGEIAGSWNRLDKAVTRIETILKAYRAGEPIRESRELARATRELRRVIGDCPLLISGGPRPNRSADCVNPVSPRSRASRSRKR